MPDLIENANEAAKLINNYRTMINWNYDFSSPRGIVEIPNGVTALNQRSFTFCDNIEIVVPNTVTNITIGAFANSSNLERVYLPDSVVQINDDGTASEGSFGLFGGCSKLKEVRLSNALTDIGWSTFLGCVSLEHINLPSNLEILKSKTFCECTNLKEIVIPDYVKSIGPQCFYHCFNLETVSIPSGIEQIWSQAFTRCDSLTTVILGEGFNYDGLDISAGSSNYTSSMIDNMIAALADRAAMGLSTYNTIYVGAAALSVMTDEQYSIYTAKKWRFRSNPK